MQTATSLIIQYILVGIILLAAIVWIAIRLFRLRKKGAGRSCCGCSLADSCNKQSQRKGKSEKCK